jgi:hypothetical protein
MTSTTQLQILRTLDKADRMAPPDIFDLLTKGRMDGSGDFTQGCGLKSAQAAVLTGYVFSVSEPKIDARLRLIDALERTVIDTHGRTGWDQLLDWYEDLPAPKNIAAVLDDLIEALRQRKAAPIGAGSP